MDSPWGIDQLNKDNAEVIAKQTDKLNEECLIYAQCFKTASGKKVLEMLKGILDSQTWSPELGANFGYYREGQNDVLRHIVNRVNHAKGIGK